MEKNFKFIIILFITLLFTNFNLTAKEIEKTKESKISTIENGWAYRLKSSEPLKGYVQVVISSPSISGANGKTVEVYYKKAGETAEKFLKSIIVRNGGHIKWESIQSDVVAGDTIIYKYNSSQLSVLVEDEMIEN